MELVDTEGKPLKNRKSKEEVIALLRDVRPKNKEQEKILAMAIAQRMEEERLRKMNKGIKEGFGETFATNQQLRTKTDGFSKTRQWRMIASIPPEMEYVAKQVWGDDVLTDPVKFKQAFIKDELGQLCLTVKPDTI